MNWRFWENRGDPRDEHRAGDPGLDPLVASYLGPTLWGQRRG